MDVETAPFCRSGIGCDADSGGTDLKHCCGQHRASGKVGQDGGLDSQLSPEEGGREVGAGRAGFAKAFGGRLHPFPSPPVLHISLRRETASCTIMFLSHF